jgi:hypothetical protein
LLSGQQKHQAGTTATTAAAAGASRGSWQFRKIQEVASTSSSRTQELLELNKDLPEADKQRAAVDAKVRGNAHYR